MELSLDAGAVPPARPRFAPVGDSETGMKRLKLAEQILDARLEGDGDLVER